MSSTSKPAGILRKEDILSEIKSHRLIRDALEENVQACSYDMTIGTIFIDKKKITPADMSGITINPGAIVSVFTAEELDLPSDIAGTAYAINSMSSEGLLVLNPGHIDPGFRGPLTVRAINMRATSKALNFGTRIFTVIFERLPEPTAYPYDYNRTRRELENEFHEKDVEQNPESLFKLVTLGKDKPLMTAEDVRNEIKKHWSTRLATFAAIVAAIFAILAVVIPLLRDNKEKAVTPIVITVPPNNQQGNANSRVNAGGSDAPSGSSTNSAVSNGNRR